MVEDGGTVVEVATRNTGIDLAFDSAVKASNPDILIVRVEPAGAPMLGLKEDYLTIPGISDRIIPHILASGLVDRVAIISDKEAIDMALIG